VIDFKALIRTIPNYPKPGIMFRDITTLLGDAEGFAGTIDAFADRYAGQGIQRVAGIEARGFILGGALARRLGTGFIPIRKRGKLPWKTVGHDYELEYGSDRVEMHLDAITPGDRVLLVDDLIATGGTALASIRLIELMGGKLAEACFIIDLPDLGGRKRLEGEGWPVFSLVAFEGE
jgi:adenine phosphoribosyltransferase